MLINENQLRVIEPEARKFLETEMEKYFFGEGREKLGYRRSGYGNGWGKTPAH